MYCGDGGWLAAAKAINAIGHFLKDQGVNFGFGEYAMILGQILESLRIFTLLTQNRIDLELSSDLCSLRMESHAMVLRR